MADTPWAPGRLPEHADAVKESVALAASLKKRKKQLRNERRKQAEKAPAPAKTQIFSGLLIRECLYRGNQPIPPEKNIKPAYRHLKTP